VLTDYWTDGKHYQNTTLVILDKDVEIVEEDQERQKETK